MPRRTKPLKKADLARTRLEALLGEGRASLPDADLPLARKLDGLKLAPLAKKCAASLVKTAALWRNEKYAGVGRVGPLQAVVFTCPLLFPPGRLTSALAYGYASCRLKKRSKILALTLDEFDLSKRTFSDCGGFDVSTFGRIESDDCSTEFEDYRMVKIAQLVNLAMEQVVTSEPWQQLELTEPFRLLVGSPDRWPIVAWQQGS